MKKHLTLLAAALIIATSTTASADKLSVGDPAPKLEVAKWVKGDPVAGFEKGKIYVVEFWATWCPPCRTSIPHLTELQAKQKNVTFIGVSVSERENGLVEPFVQKMGDKMNYRVAMDAVPETGTGAMEKNWMIAAGQTGIPNAFVINGQGTIAWIGHPLQLEEPLAKIVAGKWDIDTMIKASKAEQRVTAALRARDSQAAIAAIDEAVALDASLEIKYGLMKFNLMLGEKRAADAYAYGTKLVDGALNDKPEALNMLAWSIVDPKVKGLETRDLKLALKAAARANELKEGKDPQVLDTLAKVHFDSGELAKAVEVQQKAVELTKGTDTGDAMAERLAKYKKATAKPKN